MYFSLTNNKNLSYFPTNISLQTNNRQYSKNNKDNYLIDLVNKINNDKEITIVDIGGCIGIHYNFIKNYIPNIKLKYYIIETPYIINQQKNNKIIIFKKNINEICEIKIDIIYSNSGIQYINNNINDLFTKNSEYILLTRIPIYNIHQNIYQYYLEENPIKYTIFSENEIIDCINNNNYNIIFFEKNCFHKYDNIDFYSSSLLCNKVIK